MPLVRFTETVRTNQTPPQVFEQGKVYDLPPDAVARWRKRGKVEDAAADPVPAAADETTVPAPKPKAK